MRHFISRGAYKPDFIKAKKTYEWARQDLKDEKLFEKRCELEDDDTKSPEEKEVDLSNFQADLETEKDTEYSKLIDARAEVLSERRKVLLNKAMKSTLSTGKVIAQGGVQAYKKVMEVDKKIFHRGRVLIEKRDKPIDADKINDQANDLLNSVKSIRENAEKETDPTLKGDLLHKADILEKEALELQEEAKGKIIYQYRVGQIIRSAALFATAGGFVAGGAGAAMFGLRIVRSVGIGIGGALALAKNEKGFQSKLNEYKVAKEKLESDFSGKVDEKDYSEGMKKIEKQERITKIKRNAMKVVIIGLMAGANLASGYAEKSLSSSISNHEHTDAPLKEPAEVEKREDVVTEEPARQEEIEKTDSKTAAEEVAEKTKTPAEFLFSKDISSKGIGQNIVEMKKAINDAYPGELLKTAPESLQHIANTPTYELAKEWGGFNPDQAKESLNAFGKIDMNLKTGSVVIHDELTNSDTILAGENKTVWEGGMIDSDHSDSNTIGTGNKEFDINQAPEEGYTKLTEGEFNINEVPEDLETDPEQTNPPYKNGLLNQEEASQVIENKNKISGIKIKGNSYEDANGNIIRLDGKSVTLEGNQILVDGQVSPKLTEDFQLERSKMLDRTFTRMFAWSGDGEKSPEWIKLQKYNMETLKNPSSENLFTNREENFIAKLFKQAQRNKIDYRGKTAAQLVDELAIAKMG